MKSNDLEDLKSAITLLSRLLGRLEYDGDQSSSSKQNGSVGAGRWTVLDGGHTGSTAPPQHGFFNNKDWKIIEGGKIKSVMVVSDTLVKKEEDIMKYVNKRADGRWCARKTVDGKRLCAYGHTQAEAYKKLKELISGRRKQRVNKEQLNKFALWWLDTYKYGNIEDSTYINYRYIIQAHLGTVSTPIDEVTTMQLQTLLNALPASRIRKEVYKLLRQIFRKAYELDYVRKDVSEFLTVGKVVEKSREALNLEEQRKLWNALGDDMFSRRVKFYLLTGARPSEIATVRKEELRPGWLKLNGTKTANAVRWVKISQRLYEMLQGESPEFFRFDNKRFRQRLQALCSDLEIKTIDIYTLRHTYATNLYILRVPEKDRQVYMGHSAGSRLTNGVYTTFSPDTTPKDIYDIYGNWYPDFDTTK